MLEKLVNQGCVLQEYNLKNEIGIDFWHSNVISKQGIPLGSGFGRSKNESRKVAISEFFERDSFREIKSGSTQLKKKWGLDLISSGCGFAAGFDLRNTVIRSVGEALERWVMSNWIDEQYALQEIPISNILSELDAPSKWFIKQFDKVQFFKKDLVINLFDSFFTYTIGISIGLKDCGVFPGSFYCLAGKNNWQHSLLECHRHLLLCKNTPPTGEFPDNKVRFFSSNANLALEQMAKANKVNWPTPSLLFQNAEYREDGKFFLARTIFEGWKAWNSGPLERFLY